MAWRPGGLSDSDEDEEDFFLNEPRPRVPFRAVNNFQETQKKIEADLQDAISAGDLEKLQHIIQTQLKGNVNSRLSSGWTPLMHACHHTQPHLVEWLLGCGADVNLHGDSVTPLMALCHNEKADEASVLDVARRLIAAGALLNLGDKYGQTSLIRAVGAGRVALVGELLREHVNIEMRDMQGWTALFWAVHHNRPEIVAMLIGHGARVAEVDRNGRDPLEIAETHDFSNIVDILTPHLPADDDVEVAWAHSDLHTWHDYYPGVKDNIEPNYAHEIPNLLYGMNCERLTPLIQDGGVDLRTFLLLDDAAMQRLGVHLPFERKRLKLGLKKFHTHAWKIDAVAGLYAQTHKQYSVLECSGSAGSHLQQAYVLDCGVRFALRHARECDPAPELRTQIVSVLRNIRNIKKEIVALRAALKKLGANNPRPADLIRPTPPKSLYGSAPTLILLFSIGAIVFARRNFIGAMLGQ